MTHQDCKACICKISWKIIDEIETQIVEAQICRSREKLLKLAMP